MFLRTNKILYLYCIGSCSDLWSLDELRGAMKKEIDQMRAAEDIDDIRKSTKELHKKGVTGVYLFVIFMI